MPLRVEPRRHLDGDLAARGQRDPARVDGGGADRRVVGGIGHGPAPPGSVHIGRVSVLMAAASERSHVSAGMLQRYGPSTLVPDEDLDPAVHAARSWPVARVRAGVDPRNAAQCYDGAGRDRAARARRRGARAHGVRGARPGDPDHRGRGGARRRRARGGGRVREGQHAPRDRRDAQARAPERRRSATLPRRRGPGLAAHPRRGEGQSAVLAFCPDLGSGRI